MTAVAVDSSPRFRHGEATVRVGATEFGFPFHDSGGRLMVVVFAEHGDRYATYEVAGSVLARWADELGIDPRGRRTCSRCAVGVPGWLLPEVCPTALDVHAWQSGGHRAGDRSSAYAVTYCRRRSQAHEWTAHRDETGEYVEGWRECHRCRQVEWTGRESAADLAHLLPFLPTAVGARHAVPAGHGPAPQASTVRLGVRESRRESA